jgi:hypothetical protein
MAEIRLGGAVSISVGDCRQMKPEYFPRGDVNVFPHIAGLPSFVCAALIPHVTAHAPIYT